MKKLMRWGVLGLAVAGIALSGCGNGNSSDSVSIRVANATLTHASIDLFVNGGAAATGTVTDAVSGYVTPGAGANTLQLSDTTTKTALVVVAPNLNGGGHYTLIAYESAGVVKTAVLPEDTAAPISGTGLLRIYDAAPDAGLLDVYITAPTDSLATATPAASFTNGVVPQSVALPAYPAGTYRVRVTASGNKNDLRLDIPSMAITDQQVGTLLLTPTVGGALLNGSVLQQQATYTAYRNTNARVRLAAAVSGNATVAVTATPPASPPAASVACTGTGGACVVDAGSVAPAFGSYVLVPANSTLNISAPGSISCTATSTAGVTTPGACPIAAGADLTVLVYGTAGAATAKLVTDDNHLPTSTSAVKVSLINGVTGAAGSLTLTANAQIVAQSVAPGAVSASAQVPGSASAMDLQVTSSTQGGVYLDVSKGLNQGGAYTVMVGGDAAAPQLLLH